MANRYIPGSVVPMTEGRKMLAAFRPLLNATDGLTLGQVCTITGLEYSTVQNWIKRGYVAHPIRKKYHEKHLARILMISALRDSMKIENIGELMAMVNGDSDDESDDIVSEEQMYEYLCRVIEGTDGQLPSAEEVPDLVDKVTEDYDPADDSAELRVKGALTVMVHAYIAGIYKQEAEASFQKMRDYLPEV